MNHKILSFVSISSDPENEEAKPPSTENVITTRIRTVTPFIIIFLDINMPAVSGHDFLSKIFEMDPKAFVVVISGHDDQYNISKAGYLGSRGFMSKPFAFDEMDSYIQQCAAQPEMVV